MEKLGLNYSGISWLGQRALTAIDGPKVVHQGLDRLHARVVTVGVGNLSGKRPGYTSLVCDQFPAVCASLFELALQVRKDGFHGCAY